MTDRAQPGARGSLTHNLEAGAAWGQFNDGWVVDSSQPSRPARGEASIDETALNAFDETHSSSSLSVTIDPGEAFVDGWAARDTSTNVGLEPSTANQTIYAGWDVSAVYSAAQDASRDAADEVVVGVDSDFDPLDPRTPLWEFDTDDTGVISAADKRYIGPTVQTEQVLATDVLQVPVYQAKADIPTDLPAGTIAFAQQENQFYAEDGQ